MSTKPDAALAGVQLLDWSGPEFLLFYSVAWITTTLWSAARARSAIDRFAIPEPHEPSDPWEIAYLSAGAPRLIQLTILMLVSRGLVKWENRMLGTRLVAVAADTAPDLSFAEHRLLSSIKSHGDKGLPPSECWQILQGTILSTEGRLAANGLRPTTLERNAARWSAVSPLLVISALGIAKLLIGLSRDKPVIYLIVLLVLTTVTVMIVFSRIPHLTPDGARILKNLRIRHSALQRLRASTHGSGETEAALGFALFGPSCLKGLPPQASLVGQMKSHIHSSKREASSGGCGVTSGCSGGGSSGCGGGGCGGCGGGD